MEKKPAKSADSLRIGFIRGGLWSSGTPCDVDISDAGGSLTLTCEVMNFNVNQNLEEVVSADVSLDSPSSAKWSCTGSPSDEAVSVQIAY
jgi:hypothetical protein